MPSENSISVGNKWLELSFGVGDSLGGLSMIDRASGLVLSECYLYRLNLPEYIRPRLTAWDLSRKANEVTLSIRGEHQGVEIGQTLTVALGRPFAEESVWIRNQSQSRMSTPKLACGFVKDFGEEREDWRFVAIPFRKEPSAALYAGDDRFMVYAAQDSKGEYADFSAGRVSSGSALVTIYDGIASRGLTGLLGSEAWALTYPKLERSLLVLKYSPQGIEHSLLEAVGETSVRYGGCGVWRQGDPEAAAELEPERIIEFGTTHYEIVEGDWKKAYYRFRSYMDERGHGIPGRYSPPVHWNELYDNPLWWGRDTPERRAEHYRLEDMLAEAKKAHELGCEALYLDPGWDTSFASSIWSCERLGPVEVFVELMRSEYGLKVALHTPLAGWSDISAYPREALRLDRDGKRMESLCMGSQQYIKEKAERLIRLSEAGVAFFMFDGSAFTGPCFDERHGHAVPFTREEHCRAISRLAKLIHDTCPSVLIELHDPVVSGIPLRYVPVYYLHEPGGFDEVWALEYMWQPMSDVLEERALSLYYYSLAYSLPLYLHIDLRKDNENCLEFWWYASTCRHLGVGGRHQDHRVWEAHKNAMKTYLRLKDFYVKGQFFGLDEEVHVHTLPDKGSAVMNVFNLSDGDVAKDVDIRPIDIGLPGDAQLRVQGASELHIGDRVRVHTEVQARGHQLVTIHSD